MPTISEDFSDPEDLPLDDSLPPPTASTSSSTPLRSLPNEPISAPQIGPDGAPMIPKAVKIGPMGQLYKVDQTEFQKYNSLSTPPLHDELELMKGCEIGGIRFIRSMWTTNTRNRTEREGFRNLSVWSGLSQNQSPEFAE